MKHRWRFGAADIKQKIDAEKAFLNAKKAQLNTGLVDVIEIGDLYAATGHVSLRLMCFKASSGHINSQNDVSITVTNNSNIPIQVGNIYIPDDAGGTIYFNEQVVESVADDAGSIMARKGLWGLR